MHWDDGLNERIIGSPRQPAPGPPLNWQQPVNKQDLLGALRPSLPAPKVQATDKGLGRAIGIGRYEEGALAGSPYALDANDRYVHTHVLGNSGFGKSTLLYQMITQDIEAGHGVCLLEPDGTLFYDVLFYCMQRFEQGDRDIVRRLHLVDPFMEERYVVGFSPLLRVKNKRQIPVAADMFAETILRAKGFDNFTQSPRLATWLRTIAEILLTLERPLSDALPLMSLLYEEPERARILEELRPLQPSLAAQYDALLQDKRQAPRELATQLEAVRNVLYGFLSRDYVREIVSAPQCLDIQKIMKEGHILLFHTSTGAGSLSQSSTQLLASFLMSSIYHHAQQRLADPDVQQNSQLLRPFFVYVDEFSSYVSREIINGLARFRKYRVAYIFANQYIHQLRRNGQEDILQAVQNSTQIKCVMGGLTSEDAEEMAEHLFAPEFNLKTEKHRIKTKSQFSGAPQIRTLEGESQSQSATKQQSHQTGSSQGTSSTKNLTVNKESSWRPQPNSQTFLKHVNPDDCKTVDEYERKVSQAHQQAEQELRLFEMRQSPPSPGSEGTSEGLTETSSSAKTESSSESYGKTLTKSQTLYEEKYEVIQTTSVQFYSKDELLFVATQGIRQLRTGQAFFKVKERPPQRVQVPLPEIPRYSPEEVRGFWMLLQKLHPTVYKASLNDDGVSRTLTQHPVFGDQFFMTPEEPSPLRPLEDDAELGEVMQPFPLEE